MADDYFVVFREFPNMAEENKAKRQKGTPNKPKHFKPKPSGWEKNLGSSQTTEYDQLTAAVIAVPLIAEMTRDEYKVLQLSTEELGRCYQLCMQNTNEDLLWVGSGRDTGDQKKRTFDNMNKPRVSVSVNGTQFKVVATHVVLAHNGHRPIMPGLQASHYCHEASCMQHVIWEPRVYNEVKRKKCAKARVCRCDLKPACDFNLHGLQE